ncbi:MAG: hypothetical protein SGARI_005356 [Bacillariaceae sp.]
MPGPTVINEGRYIEVYFGLSHRGGVYLCVYDKRVQDVHRQSAQIEKAAHRVHVCLSGQYLSLTTGSDVEQTQTKVDDATMVHYLRLYGATEDQIRSVRLNPK